MHIKTASAVKEASAAYSWISHVNTESNLGYCKTDIFKDPLNFTSTQLHVELRNCGLRAEQSLISGAFPHRLQTFKLRAHLRQ